MSTAEDCSLIFINKISSYPPSGEVGSMQQRSLNNTSTTQVLLGDDTRRNSDPIGHNKTFSYCHNSAWGRWNDIIPENQCSLEPPKRKFPPKRRSSLKTPMNIDDENPDFRSTERRHRAPSRRVSDPLGGSLHSALHRPPRRIVNECRKRPSNKQNKGGRRLGGSSVSGDLLDLVSSHESSIEFSAAETSSQRSSPLRARKLSHDNQTTKTSCRKVQELFCSMASKNRCLVLQAVLFSIFGCAIFIHANHRVYTAQQALHASHEEKFTILSQMEWLDKRAKQSLGTVFGGRSPDVGEFSIQKQSYQNQIDELSSVVGLLKATIQKSSTKQLRETFASAFHPFMEVELLLEGLTDPLVIQVAHEDTPYTAWTWLDQIRGGLWQNYVLTPVGGNGIELSSFLAEEEDGYRFRDVKLDFREESAQGGEAFSVGLRNPQHRGETGLVLTIHMDEDTCGQDENEVCFGKIVDGFKSLNTVDARREPVTVISAKVL